MTPRDRIAILLHHYRDVCEGIPTNKPRGDDLIIGMCEEWNHASYQQLERLLRVMPPKMRAALRARYERYTEHRIAWCRKCGAHPAAHAVLGAKGNIHRHPPGRSITLQAKVVRVFPRDDDPAQVGEALGWLELHWAGEVDLPKAIIEHTAAVALREVA